MKKEKREFLRFACASFINGKNVALYKTDSDSRLLAIAETTGGKPIGAAYLPAETFEYTLSTNELGTLIEDLSCGRVRFDWAY